MREESLEGLFAKYLTPGEEIKWSGRSRMPLKLFRLGWWSIAAGAGLMAAGTLLLLAAWKNAQAVGLAAIFDQAPLQLALLGVTGLLLGFVLIILQLPAYGGLNRAYAVTTRRVLLLQTRPVETLHSYHLPDVQPVLRDVTGGGYGTIKLRPIRSNEVPTDDLYSVPEAESVCALIEQLGNEMRSSQAAVDYRFKTSPALDPAQQAEASEAFGRDLLPGERIEWFDRDVPVGPSEQRKLGSNRMALHVLLPRTLFLVLVGLIVLAAGVYGTTRGYWYVLIPCLLFGGFVVLWGTVLLWLLFVRRPDVPASHHSYAVTDKRVLSLSTIGGRQLDALNLGDISTVRCTTAEDGVGTLVLLPPGGEAELRKQAKHSGILSRFLTRIENAESVKALIERLKQESGEA